MTISLGTPAIFGCEFNRVILETGKLDAIFNRLFHANPRLSHHRVEHHRHLLALPARHYAAGDLYAHV
jgi:hypothetical protein